MWWRRHARLRLQLSAYIDGRLSDAERQQLEAHLRSCDACRQELGQLRFTVDALHGLPQEPAPRSFALRPEQVEAQAPAPRQPLLPAFPLAMRLAGVAAAFALAALLIADFAPFGGEPGAPTSRVVPLAGEEEAPPPAATAAPAEPLAATPSSPTPALQEAYAVPSPQPGETPTPTPTEIPFTDRVIVDGLPTDEGGGIDPLRAAEIALAAALGLLLAASGAFALFRRSP